jgi:hypothetical protein
MGYMTHPSKRTQRIGFLVLVPVIAALIGMLISILAAIAWVPMYKEVGAAYTILLTEFSVSLAFFLS